MWFASFQVPLLNWWSPQNPDWILDLYCPLSGTATQKTLLNDQLAVAKFYSQHWRLDEGELFLSVFHICNTPSARLSPPPNIYSGLVRHPGKCKPSALSRFLYFKISDTFIHKVLSLCQTLCWLQGIQRWIRHCPYLQETQRVHAKNPAQQRDLNPSIVFATTQADPAQSAHPGGWLPVESWVTW